MDIPSKSIPELPTLNLRTLPKYPFDVLVVGDSFFVANITYDTLYKAMDYSRKQLKDGRRYRIWEVREGNQKGYRVWRVE